MARHGSYLAAKQGGRRPGAGRPRFVPVASKRPARAMLKFDKELHSSWSTLKQRGGFHSDSQFVAHFSGGSALVRDPGSRYRLVWNQVLELCNVS